MTGKCTNGFSEKLDFSSRAGVSREFCFEPSLGISPVAVGRSHGDAQYFGGFMSGEADKESELHKFSNSGVLFLQFFKRLVQCDKVQIYLPDSHIGQCDPVTITSSFRASLATSRFHKDPLHGLGRGSKKMAAT